MSNKGSKLIFRISLTAMFLAFAVVTKLLMPINVPLFGAGGMKIGMAGVFTAFPAFLFGPIYGGCASGLSDLLGYLIKPDGAYIPWLTLTAFAGGFIKGLIWRLITRYGENRSKAAAGARLITLALLVVVGSLGIFSYISLNSDGVLDGVIAFQGDLPTRGQIEQKKLSPGSAFLVNLAKYNNDIITIVKGEDYDLPSGDTEITIPSAVVIDGHTSKVTRIGPEAFSGIKTGVTIYIPDTITTIDSKAFDDADIISIRTKEGSKAAAMAEDKGIDVIYETHEGTTVELSSDELETGVIAVRSSDTFRRYLAGYINFAVLGLVLVMIAGIFFILLDWLLSKQSAKKISENDESPKRYNFIVIFISIFTSGFIVTTINTEILKRMLAAWNGREFMVLWIPRVIEEMLVCLIQAYIISILYGIFVSKFAGRGRFKEI